MAAVPPITDSLSSSNSNALVLPPSSTSPTAQSTNPIGTTPSNSLVLPPSTTTTGVDATATAPTTTTTTVAPPLNTTTQPLNVVFNALASAGVDAAITQNILAPETAASTGTFSVFMESLFDALAAQSVAAEAAQANATQTSTTSATNATAQNAGSTTEQAASPSAVDAFAANANSTAPNSALESSVQSLAQTVNSQTTVSTAVTANANAQANDTLTPLQQSFDQFLSDAGGTSTGSASLGGFLEALAANLHTAPTPLGNIVNAQT